jgi:GTPase
VLKTHSTSIKKGYEPVFSAYSIRQVVKIVEIKDKRNNRNVEIDDDILRNGDTAIVKFMFKISSVFLKVGTRFILSEGQTKITGEVNNIF